VLPQQEARAIRDGSTVTIAFTITVPESRLVIPRNVENYISGQGEPLPALEKALNGMEEGQHAHIELQPHQAFGPYDEKKKMTVRPHEVLWRQR
jgi:FKBP-type peptidyl-prolyl cis-trans isomerase 2